MADERREGEPASPMVVAPLFAERRAGERTADSPALDLPPVEKKKTRPRPNWTVAAGGAVAAVIALVGAAVLFIPRDAGGNAQLNADARPVTATTTATTATTAPPVPTAAVNAPTATPKPSVSKKPVAGQKPAPAAQKQQPVKQAKQPFFFDYFSRSNGASWGSAWAMGRNPDAGSGGGAFVKNGTGRLTTSDLGDYDGRARVSRRLSSLSHRNVDIRFTFHRDGTESYPIVVARADAAVNFHEGYQLSIFGDSYGVGKIVDWKSVWAGQVKVAFQPNVKYAVRFSVQGNRIRGKVWPASRAEPEAWGVDYTDSTFTSGGAVGLSLGGGKAASPSTCYFDDVRVF